MSFPTRLLLHNKAWTTSRLYLDDNYFQNLSEGQRPEALWIGCSDSRVPAEEITGAKPGELFVHRNIANMVSTEDPSIRGVLIYALNVLEVSHVIVCGHTGCGGIQAAYEGIKQPTLSSWLAPASNLLPQIDPKLNKEQACESLVRSNVIRSVELLKDSDIVLERRKSGPPLRIHGWVYELSSGAILKLTEM